MVFWLSPWVANFARSIYWVQFTWLLPLAFGLLLALQPVGQLCRPAWQQNLLWGGVYLSLLIKSLCGYEYISFVMLGAVLPLAVDWAAALLHKDTLRTKQLFGRLALASVLALAGFCTALLIHSVARGDGDIWAGLQSIYKQDVLRRTLGGSAAVADDASAVETTVGQVLRMYLRFDTRLLAWVSGKLFLPLAAVWAVYLVWQGWRRKWQLRVNIAGVAVLASSLSWLVLAKSHSYVHNHLNYVCWYYWFVPFCVYVLLRFGKELLQAVSAAKIKQ